MLDSLKKHSSFRILGLMTGSSADGLDICLVEFTGTDHEPSFEICFSTGIEYPATFSSAFRNPLELDDDQVSELDQQLGQWFADEIVKLDLRFDCIATHGQTIKHEPPDFTLQIGDPSYMANQFKVPVIYDFRSADLREGGQGAPLIPILDNFLFQDKKEDVLSLNIGGIANITIIPSAKNSAPLLAWDTGPGNTLIDKAVRTYSGNKLAYDTGGVLAAGGTLNSELLDILLKHEFYQLTPPRSAGQEQFGLTYYKQVLKELRPITDSNFKDLIHTVTVLTAKTITDSIQSMNSLYSPKTMYMSGGGVLNNSLISFIKDELPDIKLIPVNSDGVTESNKEAFGFAYLGYCHLRGLAGNLPSVTGAKKSVVLGEVYLPTV
jgi:anhydro-N-acetylmuramic acid kinase